MKTVISLDRALPRENLETLEIERLRRENQDLRRRLLQMERERERLFRDDNTFRLAVVGAWR